MTARFSDRLPWASEQNALSHLEGEVRRRGGDILDLTVTNPTAVALPYPEAEITAALADARAARYEPAPLGHAAARRAVAAEYLRHGAQIDPATVALSSSSSESYSMLCKVLGNPGDAVLVPEPSYPLFDHLVRLEGLVPRPYALRCTNPASGRWDVDFSTLDPAGACAVVAVSPNNPTGSVLTVAEHKRLAVFAARHGIALIVDEVFSDYVTDSPQATATVAARPSAALTFALGGLSKSCGLPQMKLGWIVTLGPSALVAQAMERLELVADTYLSIGTPVQLALPSLLAAGHGIRAAITGRVVTNRRQLSLSLRGSPVTLLGAEGGWAAILRLPSLLDDEGWACRLLDQDGVLVQPGYFYDLPFESAAVVSLLPEPTTVAKAAEVIRHAALLLPTRGGRRAT